MTPLVGDIAAQWGGDYICEGEVKWSEGDFHPEINWTKALVELLDLR